MSKAKLKKALKSMTQEQIMEMVLELYDARKDSRDYLEYWIDPDIEKVTEKTRTAVDKLFFLPSGKSRSTVSQKTVKELLNNYSTLIFDAERALDMNLYAAEKRLDWIITRPHACKYEKTMYAILDDLKAKIEKDGFEEKFAKRFNTLRRRSDTTFDMAEEEKLWKKRRWFKW